MWSPLETCIASFVLSSVAGLAWLLQSSREINPRSLVGAILGGGILGMSSTIIVRHYLGGGDEATYMSVAVGCLVVLSGSTAKMFLGSVKQAVLKGLGNGDGKWKKHDSDVIA